MYTLRAAHPAITYSPDQDLLAIIDTSGHLVEVCRVTYEVERIAEDLMTDTPRCAVFSKDGNHLALGYQTKVAVYSTSLQQVFCMDVASQAIAWGTLEGWTLPKAKFDGEFVRNQEVKLKEQLAWFDRDCHSLLVTCSGSGKVTASYNGFFRLLDTDIPLGDVQKLAYGGDTLALASERTFYLMDLKPISVLAKPMQLFLRDLPKIQTWLESAEKSLDRCTREFDKFTKLFQR